MPCWSALNFSVSFRVFRGQPDWVRVGFRDRSVDALYLSVPFVVGRRAWRAEAAPYFNPPLHFRVIRVIRGPKASGDRLRGRSSRVARLASPGPVGGSRSSLRMVRLAHARRYG